MFAYLDRITGDRRPITADIFLTNYCNNHCPYCTYKRWELDAGAYSMEYGEFVKYAERLKELGVRGFILSGGGEPTMCQDFIFITQWLEEQGIHYGINTNLNQMVYIKPDYLKVSLDGWNEDTYEARRGVRMYKAVCENICKYAEWKKEHSPKTQLGIQCVVNSPAEATLFYLANKDLPVDYMVFRPIESTGGKNYMTGVQKAVAECSIRQIECLAKEDDRVKLNYKWRMLDDFDGSCPAHWSQIAIDERGNVMYCCHKPFQTVGNILDSDILEKLHAAPYVASTCDVPCRLSGPNHFMREVQRERKDVAFI